MNIHELRTHQAQFKNSIESVIKNREKLYQIREAFVKYFDRDTIEKMDIDDYVLGIDRSSKKFNFCYGLERQLDGLGTMVGATSFKFGVFYSSKKREYRFTEKFGSTYLEAFSNVKGTILDLLDAGEKNDLEAISKNPISPMFKGKILSTYYPTQYLNIFSKAHLDDFLAWYGLDEPTLKNPVQKRESLMAFKQQDEVMKTWPVDIFTHFLYTSYPGRAPYKENPLINGDAKALKGYERPLFPVNPIAEFVSMETMPQEIKSINIKSKTDQKNLTKLDHEAEAQKLKWYGDRGEKIVMDLEKNRLKSIGLPDLADQIERVSLKSDSYGYDILSFEENGTQRFIEVKATSAKLGNAQFFLTLNELQTALQLENYYVYFVYDILSERPKVWPIENPFNPENEHIVKTPVKYRVNIKVAKTKNHKPSRT